ncbi:hypothetical protein NSA50_19105 [Clostridium sp. DSM 100503]|uniref:hypothetical protein n=1 Tax=Clostridium sp. DSM 100503 TaxID=2963282 RepID=UPI002149A0CE|nr:hypothetical protein [Clostridium sp. DSM 100503]MCR1953106.1 hypothetical protein [Clostridium sp. DSM 100503]
MMYILIEMLRPLMLLLLFIMFVITVAYVSWLMIGSMKEKRNNDNYKVIEEAEEIYNEFTVYRAIIVVRDEKIEVEVDYYEIDNTIAEIKSKDGKVYITDIKNVLLMS